MTRCLSLRISFLCKLEVCVSFFSYISFMAAAASSQFEGSLHPVQDRHGTGHCCNLWCDQGTLAHKRRLPGQGCSGYVLVFRCIYYPLPNESSSALDGSQMAVDCNHHGYRDSGSTSSHIVSGDVWRVIWATSLGSVTVWGVPQTASYIGSFTLQVMNSPMSS